MMAPGLQLVMGQNPLHGLGLGCRKF
jgi:hypothetical protein